ncbi:MAG: transposase [Leptolyngbya sp. SIO1D8]|nr:transposase [Leptolyngbya sp. SIO1D8]
MAPGKLSDTDKQQLTELYCQPGETTATLAKKFGVSSSTVSRVLKQQLSEEDYAQLAQWKRSGERGSLELSFPLPGTEASAEAPPEPEPLSEPEPPAEPEPALAVEAKSEAPAPPVRRSRRRSNFTPAAKEDSQEDQLPLQLETPEPVAEPKPVTKSASVTADSDADEPIPDDDMAELDIAASWDADDLTVEDEDDYDDEDYDDEDDEDDEDDLEDDWDDGADAKRLPVKPRKEQLEILPFQDLTVQRPCYLVVDRLSELITCPLKEFAELGRIPEEEEQARTLPVFDNHRVARRFSRRNQRIVKVPNGKMLTKTQQYLHAKGITRILFDGQVYALN